MIYVVLFALFVLHSVVASAYGQSKTNDWTGISVSVDLLKTASNEVEFLGKVDKNGHLLYDETYISNAIRRYEQCWLPLQAKFNDLNIIPPLDVHWVWHTHMLAPQHYTKDCMKIVGSVADHRLWSQEEMDHLRDGSKRAWESFCPHEPYDFKDNSGSAYTRQSTYDISAAVQRQRKFNSKIAVPEFPSHKVLAEAVQRYLMFLYLKRLYPSQMLTVCTDFDLVWHSHQVHPVSYRQDTHKLFGNLLTHDDSVEREKLDEGEAVTKELWAKHFPDSPFCERGDDRGWCGGGCGAEISYVDACIAEYLSADGSSLCGGGY